MRTLLLVLAAILSVYLLLIVMIWARQERLVWQPPAVRAIPDAGVRRVDYAAADQQPLYAYVVGDPARAPSTLIAFHGNAELAAWNVDWATELHRRTGWAVVLPEYRGYGGLPGASDFAGSRRDAEAAYRVVSTTLGVPPSRIAYYGHSLGTAIAADLAVRHPPNRLVLLAPFTSVRDMARTLRGLPLAELWELIGRVDFDTKGVVQALDVPVWVGHGVRDGVVPVSMGRAVHAAALRKGELLIMPSAGHNDVLVTAGDAYWGWVERSLNDVNGER